MQLDNTAKPRLHCLSLHSGQLEQLVDHTADPGSERERKRDFDCLGGKIKTKQKHNCLKSHYHYI